MTIPSLHSLISAGLKNNPSQIQSWSRIVTAAVTDKENTPDTSHVIRQLNYKIEEVLGLVRVDPVFSSTPGVRR